MEVRPGYKQTEIGVIPDDWKIIPLNNLISCSQLGGNYPNSEQQNSYPLIKMGNMSRGFINLKKIEYIQKVIPFAKDKLKWGDVLFNTRNTLDLVGKICIWKDELRNAYFNSNILRFTFDSEIISSNECMNYMLNTKKTITQMRNIAIGTTSVAAIYARDFQFVRVPVPTKKEQETIATALSDTDALITGLEKLIAKKRQIKQGAMQELITGKKRLEGFLRKWEEVKASDFGEIVTGGTPSTGITEYWGEEYPWVTPTDISTEKNVYHTERKLTKKGLSKLRLLPPNTLLVTCIASIGKNCILKTMGGCNQQINAVIPNKDYCVNFLFYLMEFSRLYLLSNAGITATNIISKKTFSELAFTVPGLEEQQAIASTLNSMDEEITALETKLEKYRKIKQGMMQKLLTGEIRLV